MYCCTWRHWGHVVPPYCCATQQLPRNPATRGAKRGVGRGGKVRQRSATVAQSRSFRFLNFSNSRMGRLRHNMNPFSACLCVYVCMHVHSVSCECKAVLCLFFYISEWKPISNILDTLNILLHTFNIFTYNIQCVHIVREHFKLLIAQELQIIQTSHTCHFEEKLWKSVCYANACNSDICR
jgi:hypothetical protein